MTNLPIQNWLLQNLPPEDLALLGPLQLVSLPLRTPLERPGQALELVHFIETGMASVVLENVGGKPVEVGLIGREGVVGIGLAADDDTSPFETYMQVEGSGLQVGARQFVSAMEASPILRRLVHRYSRAFSVQVATTASSNGRARLEARLARWMLMVSDRTGSTFQITHEFIAIMLAVRRAGVTLALATLEGKGFVRAARGSLTILNRDGLIAESAGSYGLAENEYARLLGKT